VVESDFHEPEDRQSDQVEVDTAVSAAREPVRIAAGIFSNCSSLQCVLVSACVGSLSEKTWENCNCLELVMLESNSRLRRLGARAFYESASLRWIAIPLSVDIVDDDCFGACKRLETVVLETNSDLHRIRFGAFSGCASLRSIRIPSSVEVLENRCFSLCQHLEDVSFAFDSRLRRIESRAFLQCSSLQSIFVPSLVETIDESSFENSDICEVLVAEDNYHFRIAGHFLLRSDVFSALIYFGRDSTVIVPREIEVICGSAFDLYRRFENVTFAIDSRLRRMRYPAGVKFPKANSGSIEPTKMNPPQFGDETAIAREGIYI
jgi:hypothetical protein